MSKGVVQREREQREEENCSEGEPHALSIESTNIATHTHILMYTVPVTYTVCHAMTGCFVVGVG